jgi:hypothetical protein
MIGTLIRTLIQLNGVFYGAQVNNKNTNPDVNDSSGEEE